MSAERGRPLTAYIDTSSWNELSHQPEPGRPECVARLKRARDEGKVQTFLSRHLFQEIIATFDRYPDKGRRLTRVVQAVARPNWVIKDSPILKQDDVRHLLDPSVSNDPLEPHGSPAAVNMWTGIDELSRNAPLSQKVKDYILHWKQGAYDYKKKYLTPWEEIVTDHRAQHNLDKLPEHPGFAEFLGDPSRIEVKEALVSCWLPDDIRKLIPLPELARRLDETVSIRGMLFYMWCYYYWKVVRKEPLEKGDGYDAHHGLIAANFDVFVCGDANARKYATPGCRNGQKVMTLDEFISSLGA
jgi:hypothetical protein